MIVCHLEGTRSFVASLAVRWGVALLLFASCGGTGECENGIDDDKDGLIDNMDPGCVAQDRESFEPTACSDGQDNDGDGSTDYPEDSDCESLRDPSEGMVLAHCADGLDNDGDGLIDYPDDPGCALPLDDDEVDGCPSDTSCPACSDGRDNDDDGLVDYPDDEGCEFAGDTDEINLQANECGARVDLRQLPASGVAEGTLPEGGVSHLSSTGMDCESTGSELVYKLVLDSPMALSISTNFPETEVDTVVYLRTSCREQGTELACNDNVMSGESSSVLQVANAPAGEYYLVVDSAPMEHGAFKVQVTKFGLMGSNCDPDPTAAKLCAEGLMCRERTPGAGFNCEAPRCRNGRDDDGDGFADFPREPGCRDANDDDESDDDCGASMPTSCPLCSDGLDNDGDGTTDFGEDPDCQSAASEHEGILCSSEMDEVLLIRAARMTGSTATLSNDWQADTCTSTRHSAEDVAFVLTTPGALLSLHLDTNGTSFDSTLRVFPDNCASAELACNDDGGEGSNAALDLRDLDAGSYVMIIDGFDDGSGNYTLNVRGEIRRGEACDAAAASAGYLVCEASFVCRSGTCAAVACKDGLDNDGDGLTDFPHEPGCRDANDDDESDDDCSASTPISCPACSDGQDNDGDGAIDYGLDSGCTSAGDDNERVECATESDALVSIRAARMTGSTATLSDDWQVDTCTSTSHSAKDVAFVLTAPGALLSLHLDTNGTSFDSTLRVFQDDCTGEELECNDDSGTGRNAALDLRDLDAGNYIIVVDGYSNGSGNYTLNVRGEIRRGEACDAAAASAGYFVCEAGFVCSSGTCAVAGL